MLIHKGCDLFQGCEPYKLHKKDGFLNYYDAKRDNFSYQKHPALAFQPDLQMYLPSTFLGSGCIPQMLEMYPFRIPQNYCNQAFLNYLYSHRLSLPNDNPIQNMLPIYKITQKYPKQTQSKFKNCYGLVLARNIKNCKDFLKLYHTNQIPSPGNRFKYIYSLLQQESQINLKEFEEYLMTYHYRDSETKKKRGKSTVIEFLEQGKYNGLVLVRIVQKFLDINNSDLKDYIENYAKPKFHIKKVLSNEEDLAQLRKKFEEIEANLQKK